MSGARAAPIERAAGALLHLTSLPGAGGCGDLGPGARTFIEWLGRAGLSWWQTLPVGPTGKGFSPYAPRSSFAGGTHLVSLDLLAQGGWLTRDEAESRRSKNHPSVDLPALRRRRGLVGRAAERFLARARRGDRARYARFCAANADWLDDVALFEALAHAEGTADWTRWPDEVRRRRRGALRRAANELADHVARHRVAQFFFQEQWRALRRRGAGAGVRLMGDLPFYPALESADVWANQRLFDLDERGRPRAVAGVGPDYFSRTGQVWESPLYLWRAHERDGFAWWVARVRRAGALFDAVRLDHFIGFDRSWAVPPRARSAARGSWRGAPGAEILRTVTRRVRGIDLIAEDLGVLTPEAARLRDAHAMPGMRVLQFGFTSDAHNPHTPHAHVPRSVVYTGTHDNDTTRGWAESLARSKAGRCAQERACAYLGSTAPGLPDAMVRAAFTSVARTAIIPVQDALRLGSGARMNRPGTSRNNWRWRLGSMATLDRAAERVRELVNLSGREPRKKNARR